MSYNTVYTIPFKSLSNVAYLVEIQQDGFAGEVTELTGAANPFTVKIDDEDFLYTPTRFSTASLKLVGSDYLQSLLSTNYQQNRVVLKREGVVIWVGFIKPEMYSQDYTSVDFELQIECMSAMSTLEFLDYKKAGDSYVFVTLWDLLKKCVNSANAGYAHIYIPHVYSTDADTYAALTNVLESMTVSEQNFFDEDDKPMKLKEVLEEICKLLNWTCVDWKGDLYFIDIDHAGQYYDYTGDFTSYQMVSFSEVNIQQIGFAGSDNTLDILGGYSKASVKTSNYNVDDIFPSEDFDSLSIFKDLTNIVEGNKVSVKKIYVPSVYKLYHYADNLQVIDDISGYTSQANDLIGAFPVKVDSYNMIDNGAGGYTEDITNYSFEECIQARIKTSGGATIDSFNQKQMLEFAQSLPTAAYSGGAIAVSCSMRMLGRSDLAFFDGSFATPSGNLQVKCRLSIGNHYWYGTNGQWTTDPSKNFFWLYFDRTEIAKGGFVNNLNTKTLSMPYSGLSGYVIELPPIPYSGEIKFSMDLPLPPASLDSISAYGFLIKDLKLTFKRADYLEDVTSDKSDRIYENVINEAYVNELDEIEFKMSSYNNDDISFSKVVLGSDFLLDNLYNSISGAKIRPEENLIRRVIEQYKATKVKLNQILIYSPLINPVSRLSDNYMVNKKFIATGGDIDFEADSFSLKMIEA